MADHFPPLKLSAEARITNLVVVAKYGAGLSNILYMSLGLVMEVHTDGIFWDHFEKIAITGGLE